MLSSCLSGGFQLRLLRRFCNEPLALTQGRRVRREHGPPTPAHESFHVAGRSDQTNERCPLVPGSYRGNDAAVVRAAAGKTRDAQLQVSRLGHSCFCSICCAPSRHVTSSSCIIWIVTDRQSVRLASSDFQSQLPGWLQTPGATPSGRANGRGKTNEGVAVH